MKNITNNISILKDILINQYGLKVVDDKENPESTFIPNDFYLNSSRWYKQDSD